MEILLIDWGNYTHVTKIANVYPQIHWYQQAALLSLHIRHGVADFTILSCHNTDTNNRG
jgi:hypothetical protein